MERRRGERQSERWGKTDKLKERESQGDVVGRERVRGTKRCDDGRRKYKVERG